MSDAKGFDRLAAPVGYHEIHPDVSVNFQCNRWLQWICAAPGRAVDEVVEELRAAVADLTNYADIVAAFISLADRSRADDRHLQAAYYTRAAEFFMAADDPRRQAARESFLATMRSSFGMSPVHVPYEGGALPCYDLLPAGEPKDTLLVFGGYDSYIEEFAPVFATMNAAGFRVIAFDGPGQGGALEEHGLPLTPEWERPVGAVLDHFNAREVTAIGVSLGGGLVIRAAAFEPRIRRAVALDILDDELDVVAGQIGPAAAGAVVRVLLALRARPIVNVGGRVAAARRPISRWGLEQGMHITGSNSPYEFMRSARAVNTKAISHRVTADVLLLAGADDHYVPLSQLNRQAANLTGAQSVTTRVFTAAEQASNHCQIGNVGLSFSVIESWLDGLAVRDAVSTVARRREPAVKAI